MEESWGENESKARLVDGVNSWGQPGTAVVRKDHCLSTVIYWFRRELRLTDNTALNAAAKAGDCVVPVYILSEWKQKHRWVGPNRQEFLCQCLESLAKDLEAQGGRLIIRCGKAEEELEKLAKETGAETIFYNLAPDPFGRGAEAAVEKMAARCGVKISAHQDVAMHARDELMSGSGEPYRVYSPYFKAWSKLPKLEVGARLGKVHTPEKIKSLPLPTLAHWKLKSEGTKLIESGERAARRRLTEFISEKGGIRRYAVGRTELCGPTTSRFSQDLRWGLLSIRELYRASREMAGELDAKGKESVEKFISELAWRDFYFQILYHFPNVLDEDFSPATRGLPWREAKDHAKLFDHWCEGTTGFPIVDAGMRQLSATGYMHNRLRMIVAMFLTKDLRIYWRDGESFFMQKLTDGEIASNNGGWQWSAGTGADAAPYFRVQNPWTQTEKFDPNGEYIREWVPELRDVPPGRLSMVPADGLRLAKDYPPPMVDHATERDKTLEMFKAHRAYHATGKTELREEE